ncbi:MAG: flagellar hook-basal body protein [Lachnospiraceae bacterium]|nr:flagellar hook-basal body protein [Lachnospiraceae bacterium]
MYQGFYNLTSGMLTQTRNLNVISNNMVNIQTAGYKRDKMVSTTFQEEMLYRTGKRYKDNKEPMATTSKIRTADRTYVNYEQGSFDVTDGIYDFALGGEGFFCIDTPTGVRYTRNGSFSVDDEGYLTLNGMGRVQGVGGQPIRIDNEDFTVDKLGNIRVVDRPSGDDEDYGGGDEEESNVRQLGTLRVVDFADYEQLHKEDYGMFSTAQAPQEVEQPSILWGTLEKSNVDMVEEMTNMITSQRALQSAAQVLKMYDQVMSKAVTDVGRL